MASVTPGTFQIRERRYSAQDCVSKDNLRKAFLRIADDIGRAFCGPEFRIDSGSSPTVVHQRLYEKPPPELSMNALLARVALPETKAFLRGAAFQISGSFEKPVHATRVLNSVFTAAGALARLDVPGFARDPDGTVKVGYQPHAWDTLVTDDFIDAAELFPKQVDYNGQITGTPGKVYHSHAVDPPFVSVFDHLLDLDRASSTVGEAFHGLDGELKAGKVAQEIGQKLGDKADLVEQVDLNADVDMIVLRTQTQQNAVELITALQERVGVTQRDASQIPDMPARMYLRGVQVRVSVMGKMSFP